MIIRILYYLVIISENNFFNILWKFIFFILNLLSFCVISCLVPNLKLLVKIINTKKLLKNNCIKKHAKILIHRFKNQLFEIISYYVFIPVLVDFKLAFKFIMVVLFLYRKVYHFKI